MQSSSGLSITPKPHSFNFLTMNKSEYSFGPMREPLIDNKAARDISRLASEIHKTAVSKGWWDEPRTIMAMLMLISSEVGEAAEAVRKGRFVKDDDVAMVYDRMSELTLPMDDSQADLMFADAFRERIRGTVEEELADVIIRVLDLAGAMLGGRIGNIVAMKMAYNSTRPIRHGLAEGAEEKKISSPLKARK